MTDIYEYKANKYKLKYLKLKKELYGGHSLYCEAQNNIVSVRDLEKLDIKQIFCDNYDPKIDFNLDLKNKKVVPGNIIDGIPEKMILNNFVNEKHTGKLFTKDNFNTFDEKYEIIKNHDKTYNNIEKVRYIGKITYDKTNKSFFNFLSKDNKKQKKFIKNFPFCKIWDGDSKEYIYRISTYVGTPFSKLPRESIHNNNIKQILQNLNNGIENLITNLYNSNYILNNINNDNITLDNITQNIYFINFENLSTHNNTNKNNDIKTLIEFIKWLFSADLSKNEYSEHPLNYKFNFGYGTNHLSDRDSFKNAYDLVEKLDHNNINNPTDLCTKLEEIISAIPDPS